MDVVMDMVVLEVEVMKKREEGSGHRIDDIGVDDNVGDGHDHTKDGNYNRGSEMFKCYL